MTTKILVIDDEESVCEILRLQFGKGRLRSWLRV